jgi:hypothetical protein
MVTAGSMRSTRGPKSLSGVDIDQEQPTPGSDTACRQAVGAERTHAPALAYATTITPARYPPKRMMRVRSDP